MKTLIISTVIGAVMFVPTHASEHGWQQSHKPCAAEDSRGPCFWNADSRGNQRGTDFHRDRAGRVYRPFRDVTDHRGIRHDACWIHVADTSLVWCEDGYRTES